MSGADRVVPHNLDAECAVLGSVLAFGADRLDDVLHAVPGLQPRHFYRTVHQWIYGAFLALHQERSAIDFVTVKAYLERTRKLEDVGGPAYLASLSDGVPRSTNVAHYGGLVYDAAQRRMLITLGAALQADGYDQTKSLADLLNRAERELFSVAESSDGEQPVLSVAERTSRLLSDLEQIQSADSPITGCPTGFTDLDVLTRGLQPKELILLGARPAMGKTALALNIACNAARAGRVVAFFSMEMSGESLMYRLAASMAQIDLHAMLSGKMPERYYGRLSQSACELGNLPTLEIDDTRILSPLRLASKARRILRKHGRLDLIVLDYLQLMEAPDKGYRNRTVEVGQISRLLRGVAQELSVPVLALSQLSRGPDDRSSNDHRPRLSDLRESGALEQDADVVLLLHRDDAYNETDDNRGLADLIIAKQRNGPVADVQLRFHAEEVRFSDASTLRGVA